MTTRETMAALQNEIDELMAEANAIMAVADDEGRPVSETERTRFDEIMGAPGTTGEGLIAAKEADLERWKAVDVRASQLRQPSSTGQAARAAAVSSMSTQSSGGNGGMVMGASKPVMVPATAKRHRPIKAYESEQAAYAAGRVILAAIGHGPSLTWCLDHGILNQQQIGDPGKGGVLVPAELERTIIDLREQYGVARRFCRQYNMGAETLDIPKNLTSLAAVPVAELAQMTPTDKTWELINLVAAKWGCLVQYSSEVSEDAIVDMAENLSRDMARAFSLAEDTALFKGDGSPTYNGIDGLETALLAGSVVTASAGKLTFAALEFVDFEKMVGRLPQYAGLQPRWFIHKSAYAASMLALLDAAGGNTIGSLEAGAMSQGTDFMFLGYPGTFVNVMPKQTDEAANLAGACYFGDFNAGVAFGDRRGVSIGVSEHFYFDQDALAIRGTERFDIDVHETGTAQDPGAIIRLDLPAA